MITSVVRSVHSRRVLGVSVLLFALVPIQGGVSQAAGDVDEGFGVFGVNTNVPGGCGAASQGTMYFEGVDGIRKIEESDLTEDCRIVGSSFIAEIRRAIIKGGEHLIAVHLEGQNDVWLSSGIRLMPSVENSSGGYTTNLERFCSVNGVREDIPFGSIYSASRREDDQFRIGLIGRVGYEYACRMQHNCQSTEPVYFNCKTVLDPPQSLHPGYFSSNNMYLSGVPFDFSAIRLLHGLSSQGDPPLGDFTSDTQVSFHVEDNLYHFFSPSNPLSFCSIYFNGTGNKFCYGPSHGWALDDNTLPWDSAASDYDGRSYVYNMSGGSPPEWDVCRGLASGTPCACGILGAAQSTYGITSPPPTGWIPPIPAIFPAYIHDFEKLGADNCYFDYDLSSGQPIGASCTPSEIGERVRFSDEIFNLAGSGYTEPVTVRYNCHGLTFHGRSFKNPGWFSFAEPSLPPCSSDWYEIYETTPPGPGDAIVWFDHKRPAVGRSIHSATVVGNWSGSSTLLSSKHGREAEWLKPMSFVEGVYGEDGHSQIEVRFYRRNP